jgi:hypothetical protein
MNNPPLLPDLTFAKVSREQLAAFFAPGVVQYMPTLGELSDDVFVLAAVGMRDMSALYREPGHPVWAKVLVISRLAQDDPRWKEKARNVIALFTGSGVARYTLLTHEPAASRLELSSGMFVIDTDLCKCDPAWEIMFKRVHVDPRFPDYPSSSLNPADKYGGTFMPWGTHHEPMVIGIFLYANRINDGHRAAKGLRPRAYTYRDKGLTFLTPDILQRLKLRNALTGELMLELPFFVAASADGELEYTNDEGVRVRVNIECKAPAAYLPEDEAKVLRLGLFDALAFFWTGGWPYKKIKTYYVGQMQKQMLVCENESCKFVAGTYVHGTRVWDMPFSRRFVELMLTILDHLYRKFIVADGADGRVPIGYMDLAATPGPVKRIFEEYVQLTEKLAAIPPQNTHPEYFYNDKICQEGVARMLGRVTVSPAGVEMPIIESPRRDIFFPDVHPEIPAYLTLAMYQRYFCQVPNTFVKGCTDMATRLDNVRSMCYVTYLSFIHGGNAPIDSWDGTPGAGPRLHPLMFANIVRMNILNVGLRRHRPHAGHLAVRMWRLERAERYLVSLTTWVYRVHVRMLALQTPRGEREAFVRTFFDRLARAATQFLAVYKGDTPARQLCSAIYRNTERLVADEAFGLEAFGIHVTALSASAYVDKVEPPSPSAAAGGRRYTGETVFSPEADEFPRERAVIYWHALAWTIRHVMMRTSATVEAFFEDTVRDIEADMSKGPAAAAGSVYVPNTPEREFLSVNED